MIEALLGAETSLVVMAGIVTSFLMAAAALGTMLVQARKNKQDNTLGTLEIVDKRLDRMVDRYEAEALEQRARADGLEQKLGAAQEEIVALKETNRSLARALTTERQDREQSERELKGQIGKCLEKITVLEGKK